MKDIQAAVAERKHFSMELLISYRFLRDLPDEAKKSSGSTSKLLNFGRYDDCITGKELLAFTKYNCSDAAQSSKPAQIHFTNVFSHELILGSSKQTYPIFRKQTSENMQKLDLQLTYLCGDRWIVR